jgi:hypothetical protein
MQTDVFSLLRAINSFIADTYPVLQIEEHEKYGRRESWSFIPLNVHLIGKCCKW